MTDYRIAGTCSSCKGPMIVPSIWMSVIPPTPRCQKCGKEAVPNYGPEIKVT